MTGEITLRGRVLPIGGLTEKLLAAKRGNITHVLIPKDNERDLQRCSGQDSANPEDRAGESHGRSTGQGLGRHCPRADKLFKGLTDGRAVYLSQATG